MRKIITDSQADRVRKSILRAFPGYAEFGNGPLIVRDWDSDGDCVIIWEEGPYEWPHIYTTLTAGYTAKDPESDVTYKPFTPVRGVFTEPWNGCVLGLYRD